MQRFSFYLKSMILKCEGLVKGFCSFFLKTNNICKEGEYENNL